MSTNKMLFGMFLYVLFAIALGGFAVHSLERYTDSHVLMHVVNVQNADGSVADDVIHVVRTESVLYNATNDYRVYLLQHVGTKSANGNWIYEFGPMWDWSDDFLVTKAPSSEFRFNYDIVCTKDGLKSPEEIGVELEKANFTNSVSFEVGDNIPSNFVLSCK